MSWLSKTFGDCTGRTQRNKARDRVQWAQNAYNEAGRLKNDYTSNVEPHLKHIETALQAAMNQRHHHSNQLYSYEANARHIVDNITHSERQLQNTSQNVLSKTNEYESNLSKHQGEVEEFNQSGVSLQKLVDIFKTDAPELSNQIEEYKNMPQDFFASVQAQKDKKAALAGFSRDERGAEIDEYESGVEELKIKRADLEQAITAKYQGLSADHRALSGRHQDLTSQLGIYRKEQDRLLDKGEGFNRKRSELEYAIEGYKSDETRHNAELNRAKQLKSEYDTKRQEYASNETNIEKLVKDAVHYQGIATNYQNQIDHQVSEGNKFQGWAAGHAKKAQRDAGRFAIGMMIGGAALGGCGMLGNIGTAASAATTTTIGTAGVSGTGLMGLAGITTKLSAIGLGAGLGGIAGAASFANTLKKTPAINIPDSHIDPEFYRNFQNAISGNLDNGTHLGKDAPISSGMLGNAPKVNIPELGGWQSPKHFGMSQMPDVHEIPNLNTALGKIKDPSQLNDLTLGLPKSTNREGKSYNYGVLLDPFFNKNFKRVMKKAQNHGRYSYNNRMNRHGTSANTA
jgi:hypothetical protein